MVTLKSPAEQFLTQEEQDQVTAVVKEAEQTTSGEIVPMIVSRSHDYPMAAALAVVCVGLPLSLLLTALIGSLLWIGPENLWLFLAIFSGCFAVLYPLAYRSDTIKRFFLNETLADFEVREAALAAFYSEGLYKTRESNGILLFVSVLEHKVWILADAGINDRIDKAVWENIVADITRGIKAGRRCEAICEAVRRIGSVLRAQFPYQKSDTDELHNLIVR